MKGVVEQGADALAGEAEIKKIQKTTKK